MRVKGGLVALGTVVLLCTGVASASGPRLGPGTVAKVAGQVISKKTADHWIRIAALTEAAQFPPPGEVIVPTDPPDFPICVRQFRREHPRRHDSTAALRRHCRQRFTHLSTATLDYLIAGHWDEDLGRAEHIKISRARAVRVLRKTIREQFKRPGSFRKFLKQTGQSVSDLVFRFRVYLTLKALLKHSHARGDEAFNRLDRQVHKRYLHRTLCARYYRVPDCANFPHRHR
jgi:hypothetical protein